MCVVRAVGRPFQDALGGNSRTAMVVTVCPTTLNVDETLFALQFATRARNVSLGPAHRNVGAKNLLEEGKELRARLREAGRKKVRCIMLSVSLWLLMMVLVLLVVLVLFGVSVLVL